jgi:uncharacterized protein (DUF885 family)
MVLAGIVFSITSLGAATMNTRFNNIADRYLEDQLASSPVGATRMGDHRFDHLLDEVDAASRARKTASAMAILAELETLDFTALSRENQVDYSLLHQRLRESVWQIETLREWEWNPLVYSGLPGNALYGLLARESDDPAKRLAAAAARCREFPRFFSQARESLAKSRTPRIHAETAIDQNKGILTLINALLAPRIAELTGAEQENLREAIDIARTAVEQHQRWLETELLPAAKGNARLQEELYREKFQFDLYGGWTPEQLRERAEREMAELHERMYALSKRIQTEHDPDFVPAGNPGPDDKKKLIRACLELASEDVPPRDGVVAAARHSLEITTAFVRDRDLITLPREPLEIILMPEFRRGVSVAYCDAPGPLETDGQTFYAVSPIPDAWTGTQVASFLREYNLRSLHNLTVHEAMPGHFVQLLRSHHGSSRLRSILGAGTFIEGWAVYSECMMMDEGFLPDDLLMRLVVLKWNLRGVTNALLDQYVHLDGISEKDAMRLMMDDAFQEEREAAGKFKRAQLTSVQLSTYFAGYMEVADLRKTVEKAWGGNFDLKTFHDKITSFGSPPTRHVQALVLDEPIPGP